MATIIKFEMEVWLRLIISLGTNWICKSNWPVSWKCGCYLLSFRLIVVYFTQVGTPVIAMNTTAANNINNSIIILHKFQ